MHCGPKPHVLIENRTEYLHEESRESLLEVARVGGEAQKTKRVHGPHLNAEPHYRNKCPEADVECSETLA